MTAPETPDELRARLTDEERAEGRRDLAFPWNGPWRVWLLKHGEALLDTADDVVRLEAERDALLARLTAAEAARRPAHDAVLRVVSDLRCPSGCIQLDCSECLCEEAAERIVGLLREHLR